VYRFEPGEGVDQVLLCDEAKAAPEAPLASPILVAEEAGLAGERPRAWSLDVVRERRPGRVKTAGYNFRKPALAVTGDVRAAAPVDEATELFLVAPDAATPEDADRAATVALEAARTGAERVRFSTSTVAVAAGKRFELELSEAHRGPEPPQELFCVGVRHRWSQETGYEGRIEATPAELPFRLTRRRRAPHPRRAVGGGDGTGGPGDPRRRGRLRAGALSLGSHRPDDGESSLPVRVVHPNLEARCSFPASAGRCGWRSKTAIPTGPSSSAAPTTAPTRRRWPCPPTNR